MDRITLRGIEVWGHHGVREEERERGQPFVIDVVVELDLGEASASDALDDTVDYSALARAVARAATGAQRRLIEAVAADVLTVCLADARVGAAEVTVHKPAARMPVTLDGVSVTLRRERPPGEASS